MIEIITTHISTVLGKWLAIDSWYKIGMGGTATGFTLSTFLPDSMMLLSTPSFWDKMMINPAAWATASGILVINLIAGWQKIQQNRREEEKHKQELQQDADRHQIELQTIIKK